MKTNRSKIILPALLAIVACAGFLTFISAGPSDDGRPRAESIKVHHTEPAAAPEPGLISRVMGKIFKSEAAEKEIDPALIDNDSDPRYLNLVDTIDETYKRHAEKPQEQRSERELIVEQSSLVIDHTLGPNFPRKKEFLDTVAWSYDARQPLNEKFASGAINRADLFKQLDTHLKELGDKYASIFTDDEYYKMFQMKKGENIGRVLGITPEMAAALDKRDEQPQYDDLPGVAFNPDGSIVEAFREKIRALYSDR